MRRLIGLALVAAGFLGTSSLASSASAQTVVYTTRARPVRSRVVYRYDPVCRRRNYDLGPCGYPRFVGDLEGGFSSFAGGNPLGFQSDFAAHTSFGPSWGARLGIDLIPWVAIEAHYSGMYNAAKPEIAPAGDYGFLTSELTGEVRLTVPSYYIHPYGFIGIGGYATQRSGDQAVLNTPGTVKGTSGAVVPIGVGLGVPVGYGVSAGFEFTYHALLNDNFDVVQDRNSMAYHAGIFTGNFVLRARL